MKITTCLCYSALMLTACTAVPAYAADGQSLATPTMSRPATTPTATIDYQNTAVAVQGTLDAVSRLNVQVTAEHDAMVQQQILLTASADAAIMQRGQWTATAALTSIPLTATAQAVQSTTVAKQQIITIAQLTAVKESPTQMVAQARARDAVKYSFVEVFVRVFALFSLGIFLLSIASFAFRAIPPAPVQAPPARIMPTIIHNGMPINETPLRVENTDPVYPRMDRMVVPCGPDKFSELVKGILSDGKTLAINQWEGAGNPFTRDEFLRVRHFLQANRLAQSTGTGSLELTEGGESLFIEWLNSNTLPTEYNFGGVA